MDRSTAQSRLWALPGASCCLGFLVSVERNLLPPACCAPHASLSRGVWDSLSQGDWLWSLRPLSACWTLGTLRQFLGEPSTRPMGMKVHHTDGHCCHQERAGKGRGSPCVTRRPQQRDPLSLRLWESWACGSSPVFPAFRAVLEAPPAGAGGETGRRAPSLLGAAASHTALEHPMIQHLMRPRDHIGRTLLPFLHPTSVQWPQEAPLSCPSWGKPFPEAQRTGPALTP